MTRRIITSGIVALFAAAATAGMAWAQDGLYPGEERVELAGYPAISHFTPGDPAGPLVVFAPGAHNTARIAYGGHEGSRPEDFLAYWLGEQGINVLALSYPIDTEAGLMETAHPDFSAQDWGRQIAEGAAAAVEEHGLTGEVYLAAWSMAGKVIQPAHAAMRDAGHELAGAISLAATPGIPGIITMTRELKRTDDGYADRTDVYQGWVNQIAANAGDGEPAIPQDVFLREYVGHISGNLQGYGEVYAEGEVTIDHLAQAEDYGALAFADFPVVAILEGDDRADARHAINDRAYWTLYNTNTLFLRLFPEAGGSLDALDAEGWQALNDMAHSADDRLTVEVGGNHFFFVGEEGARASAEAIGEAIGRIEDWKADAASLASAE